MKICIDAGHGGRDPGAVFAGVRECDVALKYAIATSARAATRHHSTLLTRNTDADLAPEVKVWKGPDGGKNVDLRRRSQKSNGFGADVFVSFHCNAAARLTANGCWIMHAAPSKVGKRLAQAVFRELLKIPGISDLDPEQEVFPDVPPYTQHSSISVLRKTNAPAILIELGFITNVEDTTQLLAQQTITAVALATVVGLEVWKAGG